jgi:L-ascorbate metabolism protein UlaG (beta-lactamase superfamily)
MDLQYFGGNCVVLATKGVRLVFDDNLSELGAKSVTKADDVALFTGPHGVPGATPKLVIDGPGEYEVSGLSIHGIGARAHMDAEGTHNATMYKVQNDDSSYLILGHIYPDLTDDQLETIGTVDVLVIPIGGNGFTLDPTGALQMIKKIEPKIVVPTHYDEAGLRFEMPQQTLEQALKGLGMEPKETAGKLHFKRGDVVDSTQLVVLTR